MLFIVALSFAKTLHGSPNGLGNPVQIQPGLQGLSHSASTRVPALSLVFPDIADPGATPSPAHSRLPTATPLLMPCPPPSLNPKPICAPHFFIWWILSIFPAEASFQSCLMATEAFSSDSLEFKSHFYTSKTQFWREENKIKESCNSFLAPQNVGFLTLLKGKSLREMPEYIVRSIVDSKDFGGQGEKNGLEVFSSCFPFWPHLWYIGSS